jgi:septum formation inhibitor-activating ATPase MinD
MPQATKHQSHRTTKMLNMGDAGSGKTGALASLAKAGQRLVILDFDNGLDILIGLLKNDQK